MCQCEGRGKLAQKFLFWSLNIASTAWLQRKDFLQEPPELQSKSWATASIWILGNKRGTGSFEKDTGIRAKERVATCTDEVLESNSFPLSPKSGNQRRRDSWPLTTGRRSMRLRGWGSLKMLASALVDRRNTHKSVGPVKSLQRSKTMQLHDLHTGFSEDR